MTRDDAKKFVYDAIKDGWTVSPIYEGGTYDPIEGVLGTDVKLEGHGFVMQAYLDISRTYMGLNVEVAIWGPDGLAIVPVPAVYDLKALQLALGRCNVCGVFTGTTFRYSFAGRCCEGCLQKMRKEHEFPGWDK